MDSFSFNVDHVKVEKKNAMMMRYQHLYKIANFFRFLELFLVLILLSWFSTRLPTLVTISGQYLKCVCNLVASTRFMFLLGNVIIITLFVKSGKFFDENDFDENESGNGSRADLYDEFVKNSRNENRYKVHTDTIPSPVSQVKVYEDKEIVCERPIVSVNNTDMDTDTCTDDMKKKDVTCKETQEVKKDINTSMDTKVYRRSRSENSSKNLVICEKPKRKLQRSKTYKCGREEESKDEFRRKIEEFIKKQQKFHREESMAIVLQNKT